MKEYKAYVCKTDWDHHFPDDWHGVTLYFSEKSIKAHRKCVEECGIVEIKVSFEGVVQRGMTTRELIESRKDSDD